MQKARNRTPCLPCAALRSAARSSFCSPRLPFDLRHTALFSFVNQDGRVSRGLRLLRSVRALQHRIEARGVALGRAGSRRGPRREGPGAQRFCIGAAWRQAPEGEPFERVLDMVREVKALGLEACATLGMLTAAQAFELKQAGLDAYITTWTPAASIIRRFIHHANIRRQAGDDSRRARRRADHLQRRHSRAGRKRDGPVPAPGGTRRAHPQPESVPINLLMPMPGTPLENAPPVDTIDLIRTIAVARILMPASACDSLPAGSGCRKRRNCSHSSRAPTPFSSATNC